MSSSEEVGWEQFYDGSRILQLVANATSMPIDQVNFLFAQLAALCLALVLRTKLPPLSYSGSSSEDKGKEDFRTKQRHRFAVVSGLTITYFCFGKQILLALSLGLLCYSLILLLPPNIVHKVTLVACMTLLSMTHIYRQTMQGTVFVIDITGPLMLMVQRALTVALALNDGMTKAPEKMTTMQAKSAITTRPSFLEYFSYVFCFQSILAGPFLMFRDYQDYMAGTDQFARAVVLQRSVEQAKKKQQEEVKNAYGNNNNLIQVTPSSEEELKPTRVALRKLLLSIGYALSTTLIVPHYSVLFISGTEFTSYSFCGKILYIIVCTSLARHIYYTAWLMAEATCNMGGLGYTGAEDVIEGGKVVGRKHVWNNASNVNIMGVEFGSSLRTTLDSWNSTTAMWLRYSAYERLSTKWQIVGTYTLSSMWHGFYPGYYCSFLLAALGTYAARAVRRLVRPKVVFFQGSESGLIMSLYHMVTWFGTRLILAYSVFSFKLLRLMPILTVYSEVYFFVHIFCVAAMLILPPFTPRKSSSKLHQNGGKTENSSPRKSSSKLHHQNGGKTEESAQTPFDQIKQNENLVIENKEKLN